MNKKIKEILAQVPPDYYEKGTKNNFLQHYWHNQKIKNFANLSKNLKPKKILDVGCASGFMANRVSKIFPKSKIHAIDAYEKAIAYGKKKYPHINFKVADAHKLPYRTNSFDLVICYETIEHVVDPAVVLSEIRRVVSKDGTVLVVMDSGSWLFRIVWLVWEGTKGKVWEGAHLHPFHHSDLEKEIAKAGFKIRDKRFSHFGMEVNFLLRK